MAHNQILVQQALMPPLIWLLQIIPALIATIYELTGQDTRPGSDSTLSLRMSFFRIDGSK
jgi:hypothetical protein